MDLICFSHLRWGFVYQRPQHLLSRFKNCYRVFFIEEAIYSDEEDSYAISLSNEKIWVIVPHLKRSNSETNIITRQEKLLHHLFKTENIQEYIFWYYTPMALQITSSFAPKLVIYDCMDELSAFRFAPDELKDLEKRLFKKADIVFTGGASLYAAKKNDHLNIHCFPSSIDKEHFFKARFNLKDPEDQADILHPRFGFYGVIDERFDIDLIKAVATKKPDWHFVLIGPVVKIEFESLPRANNIHYLGSKTYNELPAYISGWDIAIVPFALNESTRFISPTKTPEYLAAGKPVISTAIQDIIDPYGKNKLVHIIHTPEEFIDKATIELEAKNRSKWLQQVDLFLEGNSWNKTWNAMDKLIGMQLSSHYKKTRKTEAYV